MWNSQTWWETEPKTSTMAAGYSGEPSVDIGPMPWGDGKVDIEDLKVFMTFYEKENPPAQP